MITDYIAFLAIVIVVIVTPGQDTALTIRNSLSGGRVGGFATALGVSSGQLGWTIAAATGLAALLAASEPVFQAVRLFGAAYLVYLGAQSLRAAWRGHSCDHVVRGGRSLTPVAAFRQGFISNVGNPKMVVFFTSLLPQFVDSASATYVPMLILGLTCCVLTLAWLSLYGVAVDLAGDLLQRPPVRRTLDAITGVALTLFGVKLATDRP